MAEGMAEVERLADVLLQRVAPDVAELDVDARLDHLGQLVPVGLREVEADESAHRSWLSRRPCFSISA